MMLTHIFLVNYLYNITYFNYIYMEGYQIHNLLAEQSLITTHMLLFRIRNQQNEISCQLYRCFYPFLRKLNIIVIQHHDLPYVSDDNVKVFIYVIKSHSGSQG